MISVGRVFHHNHLEEKEPLENILGTKIPNEPKLAQEILSFTEKVNTYQIGDGSLADIIYF